MPENVCRGILVLGLCIPNSAMVNIEFFLLTRPANTPPTNLRTYLTSFGREIAVNFVCSASLSLM